MKISNNLQPIISGLAAAFVIGFLALLTQKTSTGIWLMYSFGATVFIVFVLFSASLGAARSFPANYNSVRFSTPHFFLKGAHKTSQSSNRISIDIQLGRHNIVADEHVLSINDKQSFHGVSGKSLLLTYSTLIL